MDGSSLTLTLTLTADADEASGRRLYDSVHDEDDAKINVDGW